MLGHHDRIVWLRLVPFFHGWSRVALFDHLVQLLSLPLQLDMAEASFITLVPFSFLEVTMLLPEMADADLCLDPLKGIVLFSDTFFP